VSIAPTHAAPKLCEWCGHPHDEPAKLCHRCQIIKAEEAHIWDHIPGRRQ
jgi:hypothetical protein